MAGKITDAAIKALEVPKGKSQEFLWDDSLKAHFRGVGSFGVVKTQRGTVSYILFFRYEGKQYRKKFAQWPSLPLHSKNSDDAYQRARFYLSQLELGVNPFSKEKDKDAITVQDLVKTYLEDHIKIKLSPKYYKDSKYIIDKHIMNTPFPNIALFNTTAKEVTLSDIQEFHDLLSGSPVAANRLAQIISAAYNYAKLRNLTSHNPVTGLKRYKEHRRTRFMNQLERGRFMSLCKTFSNKAAGNFFLLLYLTGARKGELINAKWSEMDLSKGVWYKPSDKNKIGQEIYTPLSNKAIEVLKAMQEHAEGSDYLFASPVNPDLPRENFRRAWITFAKQAQLENMTIHDIRHSFATDYVSQGNSLYFAQKILGHKTPKTTQRYADAHQESLKQSMDSFGDLLEGEEYTKDSMK